MKNKVIFVFILLSAFFIRIFGLNWDQGFHLHPDERMLIMVADRIIFFKNFNPDFFNYGSLPIYLLKGLSQLIDFVFHSDLANYSGMLVVGRMISVFLDLITICLIYKIGKLLFKENKIAIFSSLFYSIAFFPIQNSHFFVVDVLLNTLITGLIYLLLVYSKSPSIKKVVTFGIIFAAMMATKFTAIIFLPIIIGVVLWKTIKQWKNLIISLITFCLTFLTFYFLFMPYAFLEFQKFSSDVSQQLKMSSDPYIFPYTLQYVGTLPYWYYIKNILLWGLGPIISILSIFGFLNFIRFYIFSRLKWNKLQIIFLCFYLFYFLIIGRSAVKFMRYMLPLYPLFAIMAGFGLYQIKKSKNRIFKFLTIIFLLHTLLWSFMFVNIYSQEHTRISATNWITQNIPNGSIIATEHWDDGLPLIGGENYTTESLTLYDLPDDEKKWIVMNEKLNRANYIIIASNRLYIPLQKLADCKKYKSCYPMTADYYQKLFSGKLNFKKVAEFSAYPELNIFNIKFKINDDSADESFTVYDHPKIIIFKKIN